MIYMFAAAGLAYFLAGIILETKPLLRAAFSNLILVLVSTLSILISVTIETPIQRPLTIGLLAVAIGVALFIFRSSRRPKLLTSLVVQSAAIVGALFSFESIVRSLNIVSVAFGDVFTLIGISNAFRNAQGLESLSLSISLKRGAGFPSLQSLAPLDDLSHGYMVFIFVAWFLAGFHLLRLALGETKQHCLIPGFVAFLIVSVSTEAVMRNLLFLTSHLLVANAILLLIIFYISRDSSRSAAVVLTVVSSAAVFMRADNALIWLFPLALILMRNFVDQPKTKMVSLLVVYLSLPLWLVGLSVDISATIVAASVVFSVLIAFLAYKVPSRIQEQFNSYLFKRAPWLPILAIIFSLATSASLRSVEAVYQNYVMGQGLWGYTVLVLVPLSLALYFYGRIKNKEHSKLFSMAFGFLGMIIWAKFGDSFLGRSGVEFVLFSGSPFEFARIGWGDSINRLFIYVYAPIMFYVMSVLAKPSNQEVVTEKVKS